MKKHILVLLGLSSFILASCGFKVDYKNPSKSATKEEFFAKLTEATESNAFLKDDYKESTFIEKKQSLKADISQKRGSKKIYSLKGRTSETDTVNINLDEKMIDLKAKGSILARTKIGDSKEHQAEKIKSHSNVLKDENMLLEVEECERTKTYLQEIDNDLFDTYLSTRLKAYLSVEIVSKLSFMSSLDYLVDDESKINYFVDDNVYTVTVTDEQKIGLGETKEDYSKGYVTQNIEYKFQYKLTDEEVTVYMLQKETTKATLESKDVKYKLLNEFSLANPNSFVEGDTLEETFENVSMSKIKKEKVAVKKISGAENFEGVDFPEISDED